MRGLTGRSILAGIVLLLVATTACSGSGGGVAATEKDFSIDLDSTDLDAGTVAFDIQNDGPSTHEFVVFKTDLAEDALPTTEDENGIEIVDEEAEGVELVDEQEDIASGDSVTLTLDLDAGNYVAICNLPAHYAQGMHASFTVT